MDHRIVDYSYLSFNTMFINFEVEILYISKSTCHYFESSCKKYKSFKEVELYNKISKGYFHRTTKLV